MRREATKERATFPFEAGDEVGWQGLQVTICQISRHYQSRIRVQMPDGEKVWVLITNITDPPPPTDGGNS